MGPSLAYVRTRASETESHAHARGGVQGGFVGVRLLPSLGAPFLCECSAVTILKFIFLKRFCIVLLH